MNHDDQLRRYPCPVCHATEDRPAYQVRQFSVVECAGCGLLYVNPRIPNENVFDVYRDAYFNRPSDGYDGYELNEHLRTKTFRRWYEQIEPFLHTNPGRALDIGCAAGYFMDVLRERGWEVEGIELDTAMHASLRERGLSVSNEPLERYTTERRFDLITLFDVLEHLPLIETDLDKLVELLSPTGIIALVTPNADSLQRKLLGSRWFQFKPVEHLYYFSPQTLRRIGADHGLKVVHLSRSGQYADTTFLSDRLRRYGFGSAAKLFDTVTRLLGLKGKSWYTDTASMFAVMEKAGSDET